MRQILLTVLVFCCSWPTFAQQESFKSVIAKARLGDANAQNEATTSSMRRNAINSRYGVSNSWETCTRATQCYVDE